MSRFAIEQYVDSKNAWRKIFGDPLLCLLKAEDAQRLAEMLDADLSPENLTCDGELRGAALQKKANHLRRAAAELKALYPNVKFYEFN